jgi:hypothetical protein
MPTEYTAMIQTGPTFEEFVLFCARDFMPGNQPVPERFEVDPYHGKALEDNRAKLVELETMSVEDRVAGCAAYNAKVEAHRIEGLTRMNTLRERYTEMRGKIKDWSIPSERHIRLREFMLEQIDASIAHDCDHTNFDTPAKPLLPIEWLERQKIDVLNNIEYHNKKSVAEIQTTTERNQWIDQLRASLQPKKGS